MTATGSPKNTREKKAEEKIYPHFHNGTVFICVATTSTASSHHIKERSYINFHFFSFLIFHHTSDKLILSLLLFSLAMFVLLSVYVCLSTFRFIFISASCVFPFKICVDNGHKKLRQQKKAEVKERVFHLLVQLRYSCRHG